MTITLLLWGKLSAAIAANFTLELMMSTFEPLLMDTSLLWTVPLVPAKCRPYILY